MTSRLIDVMWQRTNLVEQEWKEQLPERDAFEAAQEVEMPPVTTELAAGDRPDADRLLPRDELHDARVLDCAELAVGQIAVAPTLSIRVPAARHRSATKHFMTIL